MTYDRNKSVEYAFQWAMGRNPRFYDFSEIGGDCTNFVSQCIYAGSGRMNYTKDTGWYYISNNNRSASWTGVEYLYKFLVNNRGIGPYGEVVGLEKLDVGDIIQLSFDGTTFTHSSIVVQTHPEILVAQHSENYINRPLSTQVYKKIRAIHIIGVR